MSRARRILEIGTPGGYSTVWLARALPAGGVVVTLEADLRNAEVAHSSFAAVSLSETTDSRLGAAPDTLPRIEAEGGGPFDLMFIDADKPNNPHYLAWALKLSRPGTVIVGDNDKGLVTRVDSDDPKIRGTRALLNALAAKPRLCATAIQTVGIKSWDGFALAFVE